MDSATYNIVSVQCVLVEFAECTNIVYHYYYGKCTFGNHQINIDLYITLTTLPTLLSDSTEYLHFKSVSSYLLFRSSDMDRTTPPIHLTLQKSRQNGLYLRNLRQGSYLVGVSTQP